MLRIRLSSAIYLLLPLLAGLLACSHPAAESPAPPAAGPPLPGTLHRNLCYKTVHSRRLLLDLYTPPTGPAARPVVVFVHGGGWNSGDKAVVRYYYRQHVLRALLRAGYAVVSVDYRLAADSLHFPAPVADCRDAIRWVRQHAATYQLDPDNLGLWGASAGGHLALLAAYAPEAAFPGDASLRAYPAHVRYVVDNFGPTDLNGLFRTEAGRFLSGVYRTFAAEKYQKRRTRLLALTGADIERQPALVRARCARYSPLSYVGPGSPPTLIFHGDADATVPLAQSEQLAKSLTHNNVAHELVVYTGAGHGFRALSPDSVASLAARTVAFVRQHSPAP